MNTHYICRGACHGYSAIADTCSDADCERSGKSLEPCTCVDGMHNSIREDEEEEDD